MKKLMNAVVRISRLVVSCAGALLLSNSAAYADGKTLADVGTTGIAGEPNVELRDRGLGDGTYALIFTNAQTTTFTFNSSWKIKEFLVVGGGGGGGSNCGSGGGGGGVIYLTNLGEGEGISFANQDTISLTIGAGGTALRKSQSTPGGHSTLTLGATTYTAFGGGAGVGYDDTATAAIPGLNGETGCGAGGMNKRVHGETTMPIQTPGYYGNDGGARYSGKDFGAGGGGAGEAGYAAGNGVGGKGGDGLPCSITGEEVYYAAGGGGSVSSKKKGDSALGAGGLGGGGVGSYYMTRTANGKGDYSPDPVDPLSNASGFGCGGGGGDGGSSAVCTGGKGSAGIVVLLIEPIEIVSEKPVVTVVVPEKGANYARFSVQVLSDGGDNTTTTLVWGGWAKHGEEIVTAKLAEGVAVNGVVEQVATGLDVDSTYDYSFYAVNEDGVAGDPIEGSITLSSGGIETGVLPVITVGDLTVVGTSVHVAYCVAWPGTGKETCAVSLKYGGAPDKLSRTLDLGSGKIGNNRAEVLGLLPGRQYSMELTADNGTAQGITEIFTVVIGDEATFPETLPAEQPVIAGLGTTDGLIPGGVGVLYSGTFAQFAAGTVVTFHYSMDGGQTWLTSAAEVTAEGFSGAVETGLEINTDYPFYFTAEANGHVDRTVTRTFNTLGAASIQYDTQSGFNTGTRCWQWYYNVSSIGCGTNTVARWESLIGGEWVVVSERKLTQSSSGTWTLTAEEGSVYEFGKSYPSRIAVQNWTIDGSLTWTEYCQQKTGTATDSTTYTWNGAAGAAWNDPENWTPNQARDGIAGYPVYGSTAKFAGNDAVTVEITGAERASWVDVYSSAQRSIRLLGGAPDASLMIQNYLRLSSDSGEGRDCEVVLDGLNVTEVSNNTRPTHSLAADAQLKLVNGATYVVKGPMNLSATSLESAPEGKSGLLIGGVGTKLTVADGLSYAADDVCPCTVTFNIPRNGFGESVPLELAAVPFPSASGEMEVTVAIDPNSDFLNRPKGSSLLLIRNSAGIRKDKVVFEQTARHKGTFHYAGATDEGLPTELWFEAEGAGGFIMILK